VKAAIAALLLLLMSSGGANAQEPTPEPDQEELFGGLEEAFQGIDRTFGAWVVGPMATVLFYDLAFWDDSDEALAARARAAGMSREDSSELLATAPGERQAFCASTELGAARCKDALGGIVVPFIVLWLVLGAVFFTLRFTFINVRAFAHAISVTRGRYDDPNDPGEVSHFQALSSALSATVGLGNIAGVAVAVGMGGPGAVFWMILAGVLGMSSKFAECSLGQLYREVDPTGKVSGGPMRYLAKGLGELGQGRTRQVLTWGGKGLAVLFAIMCIGGSLGGGNMFQANQSAAQMGEIIPFFGSDQGRLVYGLLLAVLVGVVIIGGIRRIGAVAGFVVPIMCGVYLVAGTVILTMHADRLGWAILEILREAFTPEAGFGGLAGVLMMGFRRAAFSNEAGIGSASIAHSAAATDEPIREGIVALLEPFIDTVVVCTMTALVVVVTGAYQREGLEGIGMASWAFASVLGWFPKVLSFAAFMFAFSTMISWSYYGERCWTFLFGAGNGISLIYRVIFLVAVVLGSILNLGSVIDFSDLMVLGMAFPNILGVVLLSGKVRRALDDYWSRYKSGQMQPNARPGDR